MRSRRAVTLIEISLATAIFGLLLVCLFVIFRSGSLAWSRSDTSLELFQNLRAASVRWNNEFAETSPNTVLASGPTVSFASARLQSTFTASTPALRPLWQKFVLYYWNSANRQLMRRELPLVSPTSALMSLPDYDFGSGPQPLSSYTTGGAVLLKNVSQADFVLGGRVCTLTLSSQRATYGSVQGQTVTLQFSARCGN